MIVFIYKEKVRNSETVLFILLGQRDGYPTCVVI